ncbi:MAG: DEAD/DEAH box helicase [Gemmatimonadales bacterium]
MPEKTSLADLHPAVSRWFSASFAAPTPAQVRGWASIREGRHTLIAAPTGSGKTLAAFLIALDGLIREGTDAGELPDETRVLYVSPLKALSADVHKNLAEPRRGIRRAAAELGLPEVRITAAVRTGDTPSSERQAMLRTPPHILVTTPESLYLLLTAERSREMLRTVRTVIVDEIHSVQESRRGAHLALSLERLEHVVRGPLQRIGLSATQKPIDEVARFLVGAGPAGSDGGTDAGDISQVGIIDEGHLRELDLAIELPGSPLEAVMSREVWEEVYDRIAALVEAHRTTLVFVNTRRLAERVAYDLAGRIGEENIGTHHGSLSRERRLDAERRLKEGSLRVLVATSSLELGIDIGSVDLVCQIGSVRRIATLLQRVGRSGHSVGGTPKGRVFPLTRDELVESVALLRAVREGQLDRIRPLEAPLDVLAQQIVAEVAAEEWSEDGLFELVRGAHPYRQLTRETFDQVVAMVAHGYASQRGRRAAYVHHDGIHHRLRARRAARITAITSGGAIPEVADYRVLLEPSETYIGSLNEDFAVESMAGDIFQLGNATWRITKIESGTVRVADAAGEPPSIPFWFGEAPARSIELSEAVSRLREEVSARLDDPAAATDWLASHPGVPREAARQLVDYLGATKHLLGVIPSLSTLVLERFFDEAGGMQLVLHLPFGSRVNRAWGLALRKRFCRSFNFELQAAATEDAVLLSLGPQHSFPLWDVFRYLHPASVREILVQALLDAPVFQTRWRWAATLSLGVLRRQGGRKVPPQIQRMQAEDLLAAVFPDAAACLENIEGDRELPDHPLVQQVVDDCLHEACDLEVLTEVLRRIHAGELELVARDTPEPSTLSHEILNAKPYAFLDPAPLEERRTQAVRTRRALEPSSASELGALDPAAIERVREEARPDARDADELHDALLTTAFLTDTEACRGGADWAEWMAALIADARAVKLWPRPSADPLWAAVERVPELLAIAPSARVEPPVSADHGPPAADAGAALRDILRARMETLGPVTAAELGEPLGIDEADAERGLIALEREGIVLRGSFTARSPREKETAAREWCDRRLLARIHRYTLNRLRAEIEPVSAADTMRFLFEWQHVAPDARVGGAEGLAEVVRLLDGYEVAAAGWEGEVLPARCNDYDPADLDTLCLTGRVAWGRLTAPESNGASTPTPLRSTRVALYLRGHGHAWRTLADQGAQPELSTHASQVRDTLAGRGPSFFHELVEATGLLPSRVEEALAELVARGSATSDGFTGLRALITPSSRRPTRANGTRRRSTAPFGVDAAGRWSLNPPVVDADLDGATEELAWSLLRRYGVVFRALLAREPLRVPWRDLLRTYRRLEARGEIRGGRFVSGFSGEQFALPEAVGKLRAVRKRAASEELVAVSAVDPLNLTGIVTPGPRVPATTKNRVLYRAGVPIAALVAGKAVRLGVDAIEDGSGHHRDAEPSLPPLPPSLEQALVRRRLPPRVRAYLGSRG